MLGWRTWNLIRTIRAPGPYNDLNRSLYGGKTAGNVLIETATLSMAQAPAGVRVYPQTIARYYRARKPVLAHVSANRGNCRSKVIHPPNL
jgi:hypothetical protein